MIASIKRSAPADRGQTGRKFESLTNPATNNRQAQALIAGGMYQRRAAWIYDGIADLELCALSVLLRAPAGGEARTVLDRLPPLTMAPLEQIVREIRATLICGRWADVVLDDPYHHQLRAYSQGCKHQFTNTEAEAHRVLVELLRREGGMTT
jgi:hypothetical protein